MGSDVLEGSAQVCCTHLGKVEAHYLGMVRQFVAGKLVTHSFACHAPNVVHFDLGIHDELRWCRLRQHQEMHCTGQQTVLLDHTGQRWFVPAQPYFRAGNSGTGCGRV